ncbi:hypothetical protein BJ684DRAFT_7317 [Piptocephalis cylindrospora]|uniref:RRM domain-containing protein n=1 Tax=Piptocephalis cylindrospora TaxID=1907219 RepID=A0A4P9Y9V7_9FUNG|nr:hypothetical protein BJ684DRAFT_7317 [Piptocephalis cylindrospora]|eukprot:RKP15231.1 hypothetical protein BJ684DRAFT_7317 [Piptocephalis cylindrospora]
MIYRSSFPSESVGNIPYDVTEEQLTEIFQEVGPVKHIRLVFDRETGKPKGYGFIEYLDSDTASSAVRNLQGYEMGGRDLRVDFADNDPALMDRSFHSGPPGGGNFNGRAGGGGGGNGPSSDAIRQVVYGLGYDELKGILGYLRVLAEKDPSQARHLLMGNPSLAYASLEAILRMGVVDPMIAQVRREAMRKDQPPQVISPPTAGTAPPGPMAPLTTDPSTTPGNINPSFVQGMGYSNPEQQAIINQLLSLTPDVIAQLPLDKQEQINALVGYTVKRSIPPSSHLLTQSTHLFPWY